MKKLTFIAALILAMTTLASCGGNNKNNNNAKPSPTPTQDVIDTKEETNTQVANDAGRAVDRAIDDTSNAMGDMMR